MSIKQKITISFISLCLVIATIGYFCTRLSEQINILRNVDLPMEQNLREVEVSIWEAIHAADSYRINADPSYKELYNRQINDVEEFFPKYQTLVKEEEEEEEEKRFIDEFLMHWEAAKNSGNKLIVTTDKLRKSKSKLFNLIDLKDDLIDIKLQNKWSPDDPDLLTKEQSVREIEVSIWEALHAAVQYTSISDSITRANKEKLKLTAELAKQSGAEASLTAGTYKDLMEQQFDDVAKFMKIYKSLNHSESEKKTILQIEDLWAEAIKCGHEVVSLHDQASLAFENLYIHIDKADDIIDHKMQVAIQNRIDKVDIESSRIKKATLLIVATVFFLSAVIGTMIIRAMANPIMEINEAVEKVGKGDLSVRTKSTSNDEIGNLAKGLNNTLDELQIKQDQLVQAAKLASLGEMSASLAHELNNPIHFIKGANEIIQKRVNEKNLNDDKIKQFFNGITESVVKMEKIIQHFRDFSRISKNKTEKFQLNAVIDNSFILLEQQLKLRDITVNKELSEKDPVILGDSNRLEQVFTNLLTNARDALGELEKSAPKTITVRSKVENDEVLVEFEDNGPGITEEVQKKLFEPFFTTKDQGKGTGLGLSISHGIIEEHKGEISVRTADQGGTIFSIKLPLQTEEN